MVIWVLGIKHDVILGWLFNEKSEVLESVGVNPVSLVILI